MGAVLWLPFFSEWEKAMKATSYKRYTLSEAEKNERSRQSLSAIDNGQVFDDDEIAEFLEKLDSESPLPIPRKVKLSPKR